MRVTMEAVGIKSLVHTVHLGTMEVAIYPNNGREAFDEDLCLMHCMNMVLASSSCREGLSTLGALMWGRSTRKCVRDCLECWADTYMLILEVILGIAMGNCKRDSSVVQ